MMAASALNRSLPLPASERSAKPCHVRSSSLPCTSHPLLVQLKDLMQQIRSWILGGTDLTAQDLLTGLRMMKSLYDSVRVFLHLPQAQDLVHQNEKWANQLLDDQLKFLDVFGVVGSILSSLREYQLSALVSLRTREPSNIEASLQGLINQRKKSNKEMNKLCTFLKIMMKQSSASFSNVNHLEILRVLNDVKALTVSIAVAVISSLCSSPRRATEKLLGLPKRKTNCIREMNDADCAMDRVLRLRGRPDVEKLKMTLESMAVLEDCLAALERGNDSVFRSLINTRVSILNIITQ